MANAERGEVELVAGTKVYTLVLSMNAICEMQTRTKKTYGELLSMLQAGADAVVVRDFIHMTLKKHHGQEFHNVEAVGDLIDEVDGGTNGAMQALERLFVLNGEKAKKLKGETPDPLLAQT